MRIAVTMVVIAGLALGAAVVAPAQVCNLRVVTDASPDYSDMDSMIRSITGRWEAPADKCWALWYWNHLARRQTAPIQLHGLACTDPIRQFNDYGYTMCSTIAGINCSIWDAMGFGTKYWDISLHTVPEVEYDGAWHMYDNSLSALYTLCDGKTIAGVQDIGKEGACAASGGKVEKGHIARYHCLTATSAKGYLTGADTARDLDQEYRCFNPNGLKYRYYYYDWDRGHRYILNLRDGEVYTRTYRSLGDGPEYYVPNGGKDPEAVNRRYHLRGNGVRAFTPNLTPAGVLRSAQSLQGMVAVEPSGVQPAKPQEPGEIVFKVEGANVITALTIRATLQRATEDDQADLAISTTNGLTWSPVWKSSATGENKVDLKLVAEVSGAYEVLVRCTLLGRKAASDARLTQISFETNTMLNSKTQPQLLLGRNTIYVGAGDPTESIVVWPDLRGTSYKPYVVEEHNMVSEARHPGYMGPMHAQEAMEDAYVVFRVDAPADITRVTYGGRFYNRAPRSHVDLLHSFDGGETWTKTYSLTDTKPPWDVLRYETVEPVPAGTRSVLFKYLLNSSAAGPECCSLYSVRMEVNHKVADPGFKPLEVTFNWSERQADYSLVERSHTELVTQVPYRYTLNVGGVDHPVVNWLRIARKEATPDTHYGYSDGVEAGGVPWRYDWATYGRNLAEGKPYTCTVPSGERWGAKDPDLTRLTDGVVGAPYAGGIGPSCAAIWEKGQTPDVTVDLGSVQSCAAFRIHVSAGYPWWDALKGQVKDTVQVFTSTDGEQYASQGFFALNLRRKDIPINQMMPDEETATGYLYELAPEKPVQARYVRFAIRPQRSMTVSEVQALDAVHHEPFDLRIALPDDEAPYYRKVAQRR
ncbi:MAG: hypothetical protein ABFE16_06975 [Armatimonadia bacterium]